MSVKLKKMPTNTQDYGASGVVVFCDLLKFLAKLDLHKSVVAMKLDIEIDSMTWITNVFDLGHYVDKVIRNRIEAGLPRI